MEVAESSRWSRTRDFVRETRSEMKKVAWPGRKEVVSTTIVVLVTTIFFGIYLGICDQIFGWLQRFLFEAVNVSV